MRTLLKQTNVEFYIINTSFVKWVFSSVWWCNFNISQSPRFVDWNLLKKSSRLSLMNSSSFFEGNILSNILRMIADNCGKNKVRIFIIVNWPVEIVWIIPQLSKKFNSSESLKTTNPEFQYLFCVYNMFFKSKSQNASFRVKGSQ